MLLLYFLLVLASFGSDLQYTQNMTCWFAGSPILIYVEQSQEIRMTGEYYFIVRQGMLLKAN